MNEKPDDKPVPDSLIVEKPPPTPEKSPEKPPETPAKTSPETPPEIVPPKSRRNRFLTVFHLIYGGDKNDGN